MVRDRGALLAKKKSNKAKAKLATNVIDFTEKRVERLQEQTQAIELEVYEIEEHEVAATETGIVFLSDPLEMRGHLMSPEIATSLGVALIEAAHAYRLRVASTIIEQDHA